MVGMAAPSPDGGSSPGVLPGGLSSTALCRHLRLRQQSIDSLDGVIAESDLPTLDEMEHCCQYFPIVRGHFAHRLNDI